LRVPLKWFIINTGNKETMGETCDPSLTEGKVKGAYYSLYLGISNIEGSYRRKIFPRYRNRLKVPSTYTRGSNPLMKPPTTPGFYRGSARGLEHKKRGVYNLPPITP